MLPPDVPTDYPSFGEIQIFRQLRDDPRTADWVVLHSLCLAEPGLRAAGEVDFVVIIPGKGIVCLEVKGCSAAHLRRSGGLWFYGPDDRGDPRGPFRQASDGMYALRRKVWEACPDLRGILFTSGVAFPFAPFSEHSVEWSDWQVIDSRMLSRQPISALLVGMAEAARSHLLALPNPPRLDPHGADQKQCERVSSVLRGDFDVPVDLRARARALEDELARYTAEQFIALDGMADNPRVVFTGPAGTGKTVLALDAARRAHAVGRRVLLVCFNRLLALWLEERMKPLRPGVTVGTLHRRMLAVSGSDQATSGAGSSFWETELPSQACDRMLSMSESEGEGYLYDELIVDEAQDLLRPQYLDFLDLSLRSGLAGGRWRVFGDFERQAIYGAATLTLEEFINRWAPDTARFSLRDNCRNTPLTASWVHYLARLQPPYSRIRRPDDRVNPEIQFYRSASAQREFLTNAIEQLQRSGFAAKEIVVLSPRAEGSCGASLASGSWSKRLSPLTRPMEGRVGFATVQAFKGLEAPAVIVTDIDSIVGEDAQALFYVAVTRAVQRLHILAHESVREEFGRILVGAEG